MKGFLLLITLSLCGGHVAAQGVCDSVKMYFHQNRIGLDPTLRGNQQALDRIADSLRTSYADSVLRLRRIEVVGAASPEGRVGYNKWLSERRANTLFSYLSKYGELPDSLKTTVFVGRDWNGLIRLVETDPKVPYRAETLSLLLIIADEVRRGVETQGDHVLRLKRLRGGVPYKYLYNNLFPPLRASKLRLWYERIWNPVKPKPVHDTVTVVVHDTLTTVKLDTVYVSLPCPESPFYMDIRTNLLYDALAVPNIGVEFYLGKNWSIVGNWAYAWWKTDRRHRYWRLYGGDIAVRKWFGRAATAKPLTGHHVGVYGSIFTFDFEWGGRGYMGGKPGGTLWGKMNYAAGVEYGYSLPIARRLNIDFNIGVGYWGGTYHEYLPQDDCYVWQCTKQRHWFGPTKAEVSLVWLIGRGNYNKQKGGVK